MWQKEREPEEGASVLESLYFLMTQRTRKMIHYLTYLLYVYWCGPQTT